MEDSSQELYDAISRLGNQTDRVANALEKQVNLKRRFATGIVFGVGTALGASVIATIIVLSLARVLAPIGIDFIDTMNDARDTLEAQLRTQSPQ